MAIDPYISGIDEQRVLTEAGPPQAQEPPPANNGIRTDASNTTHRRCAWRSRHPKIPVCTAEKVQLRVVNEALPFHGPHRDD